ncbi:hypothetical protein [Caldicellulosiruptor naganoensis]|uniref:hypothetical protein n=1 Tax=Caldicellulosiruptor naganoensis TaxID=29324 RepID=UPI000B2F543E|nr:hypothetical protein [Caldicellulosiruptor naganoensis]
MLQLLPNGLLKMLKLLMVKLTGYYQMCEIANLIGNPMMEEYYADLALKQYNTVIHHMVKEKRCLFYAKVLLLLRESQELGENRKNGKLISCLLIKSLND